MTIIAEHAFFDNWQNLATSTKTIILLEILVATSMGTPTKMLAKLKFPILWNSCKSLRNMIFLSSPRWRRRRPRFAARWQPQKTVELDVKRSGCQPHSLQCRPRAASADCSAVRQAVALVMSQCRRKVASTRWNEPLVHVLIGGMLCNFSIFHLRFRKENNPQFAIIDVRSVFENNENP